MEAFPAVSAHWYYSRHAEFYTYMRALIDCATNQHWKTPKHSPGISAKDIKNVARAPGRVPKNGTDYQNLDIHPK